MPRTPINPFVYGRPVQGNSFFGRRKELSTVLHRLHNGESTAIVGEPHIGKTSLLKRLCVPQIISDVLGDEVADNITPHFLDLHDLPKDYTQLRFWQDVLTPIINKPGNRSIARILRELVDTNYDRSNLEKLFGKIDEGGRKLFLLLDEFEILLAHKNFQDSSFFTGIRKIISHVGGLVIVTASRISVDEMNVIGRGILDVGSPFFNTMISLRLKAFDGDVLNGQPKGALGELLTQESAGFNRQQLSFIQCVAGRHPYLLQSMAASLFENIHDPATSVEICYDRISFHFADIWDHLPENSRTVAVILSLLVSGGRVHGQEFNFGEIENNERFEVELRRLAESGLAELVTESNGWILDWDNLLIWRGQKWAIGSHLFSWWINEQILINPTSSVGEWIDNKRYVGILTNEQWKQLVGIWKVRPEWVNDGLRKISQAILKRVFF